MLIRSRCSLAEIESQPNDSARLQNPRHLPERNLLVMRRQMLQDRAGYYYVEVIIRKCGKIPHITQSGVERPQRQRLSALLAGSHKAWVDVDTCNIAPRQCRQHRKV